VSIIIKENKEVKKIIDFCTGSGCIALSLKKAFPSARVEAVDVSEQALQVAKDNAQYNNLEIDFIKADVLDSIAADYSSLCDVIVSNPPYVLESDKQQMSPNVLKYEPHLALFVDDDKALLFYEVLIPMAFKLLNSKGKLYFEIHEEKGEEIKSLMFQHGFTEVRVLKDFYDKFRFVVGVK